jgi:hypothetical protein
MRIVVGCFGLPGVCDSYLSQPPTARHGHPHTTTGAPLGRILELPVAGHDADRPNDAAQLMIRAITDAVVVLGEPDPVSRGRAWALLIKSDLINTA